jgi:hypothetical protein
VDAPGRASSTCPYLCPYSEPIGPYSAIGVGSWVRTEPQVRGLNRSRRTLSIVLRHLRRHRADPAAGDRPGDLGDAPVVGLLRWVGGGDLWRGGELRGRRRTAVCRRGGEVGAMAAARPFRGAMVGGDLGFCGWSHLGTTSTERAALMDAPTVAGPAERPVSDVGQTCIGAANRPPLTEERERPPR